MTPLVIRRPSPEFVAQVDALLDIPQPELDELAATMARRVHDDVAARVLGLMSSNDTNTATDTTPIFEFQAPPIEIYRPDCRPFLQPWYAGVVLPAFPSLCVTACESDEVPRLRLPVVRGHHAERLRMQEKAWRASSLCRRALARGDERRARYWVRRAVRLHARCKALFSRD